MSKLSPCQGNHVKAFLDDQLHPAELQDFQQHLEICSQCRQRLDDLCVESQWWDEARHYLTDAELLAAPSSNEPNDALGEQFGEQMGLSERHVVSSLSPTDDPLMLGRLAGYEVAGVVGSGGMGVVLKGFDRALNRFVAIKVLAPHLAESAAARRRFAREARAAAAVVHDNVVAIHGVAEANGLHYFVMTYHRGTSLQKRLDESGALQVSEILRIGMQTAAGLAAAHHQGLVHRDIKPANLMLADGVERVTITDFGLARAADDASLTRTGMIAGTPQFMSPEQAAGEPIDGRSDLFSLGSVLYTACTGRPPFRAENSLGVLRKISESEPTPIQEVNPDIPTWLCQLIQRLLRKSPAARYPDADTVARLLSDCLAHVQQPHLVPLPTSLHNRPQHTRPYLVAAVLATVLLITAVVSAWTWRAGHVENNQTAPINSIAQNTNDQDSVDQASAKRPSANRSIGNPVWRRDSEDPIVPAVSQVTVLSDDSTSAGDPTTARNQPDDLSRPIAPTVPSPLAWDRSLEAQIHTVIRESERLEREILDSFDRPLK